MHVCIRMSVCVRMYAVYVWTPCYRTAAIFMAVPFTNVKMLGPHLFDAPASFSMDFWLELMRQ